jgi:Domain of Unknown Function (DUF748)
VTVESLKVNQGFAGGSAKSVEVTKPLFRVTRDKAGIQLLGWTIDDPIRATNADATQDTTQNATQSVSSEPQSTQRVEPSTPTGDMPEWKVDRLLVTGLDAMVNDVSVEPQLTVPLTNLDVEVRGLNTRALRETKPIRFNALVGAGKVNLPNRKTATMEERDLLSQVTATGVMVMHPNLDGWAKASVAGFELGSIEGLAKDLTGINLTDGIFDGSFDLRFRDGGNLDLRSKLVLTDLKVEDSADGFLQRTLKLPAPLQVGIDAVKDASGSISLPINVPVRAGEVSVPAVVGSAAGAIGQVAATAIASAPLKLLQGLGGEQQQAPPLPPVTVQFDPGDPGISDAARAELLKLVEAMNKDRNMTIQLTHTIGGGDIERASTRANPTPQQAVSMANELRASRFELANRRATVAGQARAAAINEGDAAILIELRSLDRELARIDDALDRVLDLQRPGADRQAQRRTRAAALDVANWRIDGLRRFFVDAGVRDAATRVSFANPSYADATDEAGGSVVITSESKKRAK